MSDNIITLVITAIMTFGENPLIATPKAVPDAGGCSVSIITIMKIEEPTASEYKIMENKNEVCGIWANNIPQISPTRWPPTTFLGFATTLFGIANTTKVEAPIDAVMTAFCNLKKIKTMKIAAVARRLCNT